MTQENGVKPLLLQVATKWWAASCPLWAMAMGSEAWYRLYTGLPWQPWPCRAPAGSRLMNGRASSQTGPRPPSPWGRTLQLLQRQQKLRMYDGSIVEQKLYSATYSVPWMAGHLHLHNSFASKIQSLSFLPTLLFPLIPSWAKTLQPSPSLSTVCSTRVLIRPWSGLLSSAAHVTHPFTPQHTHTHTHK